MQVSAIIPIPMQKCKKCLKEKPKALIKGSSPMSTRKSARMVGWCAQCRTTQLYKEDPEREKRTDFNEQMRRIGVQLAYSSYVDMVKSCGGRCYVCKCIPTHGLSKRKGRISRLHVDHDHATGKVRGLLCGNCNLLLGHAHDNVMVLQNAIAYLRGLK